MITVLYHDAHVWVSKVMEHIIQEGHHPFSVEEDILRREFQVTCHACQQQWAIQLRALMEAPSSEDTLANLVRQHLGTEAGRKHLGESWSTIGSRAEELKKAEPKPLEPVWAWLSREDPFK